MEVYAVMVWSSERGCEGEVGSLPAMVDVSRLLGVFSDPVRARMAGRAEVSAGRADGFEVEPHSLDEVL